MPTIIVIEPHPLLRLGILQLLSNLSATCSNEGVDYSELRQNGAVPRKCDLVLLAIPSFEDMHEVLSLSEQAYAPKAVLLLSESSDMPATAHSLPPSVAGYVQKNAPPEVLQAAVRLVLAGGTCFPLRLQLANAQAALPALKHFDPVKWPLPANKTDKPVIPASPESEMLGLTPRQYEVLVLLARGYPMKTVGRYLNISVATAKAHTETLYQRLDVHNRNAAVYEAVSRGATLGWPGILSGQTSDIVQG